MKLSPDDYNDDAEAWQQIAGKVHNDGGVLYPKPGVLLSDEDMAAITFLCNEWDYGYEPVRPTRC